MTSQSSDWAYSYHAVAYLDILGQKDAFDGVVGVKNDPNFIASWKQTVLFIRSFREGFENIFNGYSKNTNRVDGFPAHLQKEALELKEVSLKFYGVSDSVIAWTTLKSNSHQCRALNGLYGILLASASMVTLSMAVNHAIRGGIEIDGAVRIFKGTNEIYGPALNRAYVLESKQACWPRILIGDGLIRYLKTISENTGSDIPSVFSRKMAEQCSKLIMVDSDGKLALDYLSPNILSLSPQVFDKNKVLLPAKNFVRGQIARFASAECSHPEKIKLHGRYSKVLDYFNYRLPGLS